MIPKHYLKFHYIIIGTYNIELQKHLNFQKIKLKKIAYSIKIKRCKNSFQKTIPFSINLTLCTMQGRDQQKLEGKGWKAKVITKIGRQKLEGKSTACNSTLVQVILCDTVISFSALTPPIAEKSRAGGKDLTPYLVIIRNIKKSGHDMNIFDVNKHPLTGITF